MNIRELKFHGLLQNRPLGSVSGPEFMNAIASCGWREGPGCHFLRELRRDAANRGIANLGDLARQIARGESVPGRDGKWLHWVCGGTAYIVFNPVTRVLITFSPGTRR